MTVLPIDEYDDLVGVLGRLRAMLRPPRVIVAGSTSGMTGHDAERVVSAAELLGAQLAQRNIPVVHGGSEVGAALSRRLAETARLYRGYDPAAITALRRRVHHGYTYIGYPPGPGTVGMPRVGTIRFVGESAQDMRSELVRLGCVGGLIGGGAGSAQEVDALVEAGLPVVPWPATGGTAAARAGLLSDLLGLLPSDTVRAQTRAALTGPDLELGAVAMANLVEVIQRPYADTGPTGAASALL